MYYLINFIIIKYIYFKIIAKCIHLCIIYVCNLSFSLANVWNEHSVFVQGRDILVHA